MPDDKKVLPPWSMVHSAMLHGIAALTNEELENILYHHDVGTPMVLSDVWWVCMKKRYCFSYLAATRDLSAIVDSQDGTAYTTEQIRDIYFRFTKAASKQCDDITVVMDMVTNKDFFGAVEDTLRSRRA